MELKIVEQTDTSVTSIWKKKCLDLFEVCQSIKKDNEELKQRCYELVVQGLELASAVHKQESDNYSVQKLVTVSQKDSKV